MLKLKAKFERSGSSYFGFKRWDQARSTRGQPGDNPGSTRGLPAFNPGSTCGQPGVNPGSTCGQPGVNLRSNPGSTCGQPAPPYRGAAAQHHVHDVGTQSDAAEVGAVRRLDGGRRGAAQHRLGQIWRHLQLILFVCRSHPVRNRIQYLAVGLQVCFLSLCFTNVHRAPRRFTW